MRQTLLLALFMWLAAAPMAGAGAWLRADGGAMLSFSHEATRPRDGGGDTSGYSSVYGEYGLTPRLTLGIDAGLGRDADDWKALVFLRMAPPGSGLVPGELAAELALGAAGVPGGGTEPLVRPGLSWGKGIATPWGDGWVNLDALATHRVTRAKTDFKLELTMGITPSERMQVSVQVRGERLEGSAATLRLVPALSRRLGARTWVTLGGIWGIRNDETLGLILGSRIEF